MPGKPTSSFKVITVWTLPSCLDNDFYQGKSDSALVLVIRGVKATEIPEWLDLLVNIAVLAVYVVDSTKQLYGSFQDSPEEQRAVLRVTTIFKPNGQYIELSHPVLALLRERMNQSSNRTSLGTMKDVRHLLGQSRARDQVRVESCSNTVRGGSATLKHAED